MAQIPQSCADSIRRAVALANRVGLQNLAAEILEGIVTEEAAAVLAALGSLLHVWETLGLLEEGARDIRQAFNCLRDLITGSNSMACASTHNVSSRAQGPGVCCAAFSAANLTPAVGARVAATDSKGHCFVCEVKASTSRKHPGQLVFKRGQSQKAGSNVSCPTTQNGCCSLLGQ